MVNANVQGLPQNQRRTKQRYAQGRVPYGVSAYARPQDV